MGKEMYTFSSQQSAISGQIKLIVNGNEKDVSEGATILGLLNELAIKPQGIAVELNLEIVPKSKFGETVLKNGDKIEIVRMAGGG